MVKMLDLKMFSNPFKIIVIGMKYLKDVLVAEKVSKIGFDLIMDITEGIDDENFLKSGDLYEANKRFL